LCQLQLGSIFPMCFDVLELLFWCGSSQLICSCLFRKILTNWQESDLCRCYVHLLWVRGSACDVNIPHTHTVYLGKLRCAWEMHV